MATDSSRRSGAPAVVLRQGLGQYAKAEYGDAATAFLKVMAMCKCRAGVQKQPSILAEIMAAVAKNDLKSALAKMTASSTRCDNPLHLDAFDSLIATYEKQGRIDDALESAAKLINLCPREPKAFLRLGKLLRLQNKPTMAYLTYKQGIELVKRKHPGHASLQALCEQRDKVKAFAKFDPLPMFPIELVRMLFKHVSFKTQCCSLRVSKTWKAILTSPDCRDLWQTQLFNLRSASHPGLSRLRKTFQRYAEYAKNATTELSINGCSFFFQSLPLEQLLLFSKTLKVLQLREPRGLYHQEILHHFAAPQLTSLYLGGVQFGPNLLRTVIEASSDSLEELSLFEFPLPNMQMGMLFMDWPRLEKLKVARLSFSKEAVPRSRLSLFMALTPNLEEAWLDHVQYNPHELALRWPKLRSLFIGEDAASAIRGAALNSEPFINKDLRELHLEGRKLDQRMCMIYPGVVRAPFHLNRLLTLCLFTTDIPALANLEKLSLLLHNELTNAEFERIVRPSMESGTLRELDVRPLPSKIFFPHVFRRSPLPDWLQSDRIEYMSVSGFTAPGSQSYSNFEGVLDDIIERFPNLRRVDVGLDNVSDSVLAHWIRNGVREVYHRLGDRRADLARWAKEEHGARFFDHPPRHIPSMRPDRALAFNRRVNSFQFNYEVLSER
ncbi:hypothetical protein F4818DRAFT_422479 [Hypoxylon cercidicola]|nr:hypothetical protein F4818DRAFT_422479 [Hypoxylon cercidicola]